MCLWLLYSNAASGTGRDRVVELHGKSIRPYSEWIACSSCHTKTFQEDVLEANGSEINVLNSLCNQQETNLLSYLSVIHLKSISMLNSATTLTKFCKY